MKVTSTACVVGGLSFCLWCCRCYRFLAGCWSKYVFREPEKKTFYVCSCRAVLYVESVLCIRRVEYANMPFMCEKSDGVSLFFRNALLICTMRCLHAIIIGVKSINMHEPFPEANRISPCSWNPCVLKSVCAHCRSRILGTSCSCFPLAHCRSRILGTSCSCFPLAHCRSRILGTSCSCFPDFTAHCMSATITHRRNHFIIITNSKFGASINNFYSSYKPMYIYREYCVYFQS